MLKVLVVDDSPIVRRSFERVLSADPEITAVRTAPDPYVARDVIAEFRPQVVTLDVEMPRMDGITFLRKVMRHFPLPVIVVSSLTTRGSSKALEALEAGAVDIVAKPGAGSAPSAVAEELVRKVKAAAHASTAGNQRARDLVKSAQPQRLPTAALRSLIAVGASTGGTVALEVLLRALPAATPPMVITQHMPAFVTASFAARLNAASQLTVKPAETGDQLVPGLALLAPGDKHLLVRAAAGKLVAEVKDGPRVNHHRPSVDVMFRSVARAAGGRSVAVLMTGMGSDGAKGMAELKEAGARTIAQDEASCVVYGMPRAAVELGVADEVVSLEHIARHALGAASR